MWQGSPLLDVPTHTHTHTHIRGLPVWKPDREFFPSGVRDAVMEYTQLGNTWRLAKNTEPGSLAPKKFYKHLLFASLNTFQLYIAHNNIHYCSTTALIYVCVSLDDRLKSCQARCHAKRWFITLWNKHRDPSEMPRCMLNHNMHHLAAESNALAVKTFFPLSKSNIIVYAAAAPIRGGRISLGTICTRIDQ